jgi:hypothetical protein
MVHPLSRRLTALAVVPLLAVVLGGCSAIGRVVIDELGGDSQSREDDPDRGADEDSSYVTHDNGNTDFYDLAVGMCIDEEGLFGADYYASVDVVDCGQPHYAELYSLFDIADPDAGYPGEDEVSTLADEGCGEDFVAYVGTTWERSEYDYYSFYPGLDNWEDGDHEVMCLVIDYDLEPLSGSVRNGEI